MELSKTRSDTLALVSKYLRENFSPQLFQHFCDEINRNQVIPEQLDWSLCLYRPSFREWSSDYDFYDNFTIEKIYADALERAKGSSHSFTREHQVASKYMRAREYGFASEVPPSLEVFGKMRRVCSVLCHLGRITQVVFDKTGKYFVVASTDCLMKVWQLDSIRLLWTFRGHLRPVNDLTISPTNAILASCGSERRVRMWRLKDGQYLGSLTGHSGHVSCVEFSPAIRGSCRYLVAITDDGGLFVWPYTVDEDGKHIFPSKPLKKFKGPKSGVKIMSLTFSAGGLFLVTGCSDSSIRIYSFMGETPQKVADLAVDHAKVSCVLFSNHIGKFISGCTGGNAKIWTFQGNMWRATVLDRFRGIDNTAEGGNRVDGRENVGIRMLCWSCDDSRTVTSYNDGLVAVWNSNSGELERRLKRTDGDRVAITMDNHPIDANVVAIYYDDRCLILWDISRGEILKQESYQTQELVGEDGSESNGECLFSPCGTFLILSHLSPELTFYSYSSKIGTVPDNQFFNTDFMPFYEVPDRVDILDEETRLPYHFLPPPLMVDYDGFPLSNHVQFRVPGRELMENPADTLDVGEGESRSAFGSDTDRSIIPLLDDAEGRFAKMIEDTFELEVDKYLLEVNENTIPPAELPSTRRLVGRVSNIVVEGRQIGFDRMVLETDHDESQMPPPVVVPEEIPEIESSTDDEDAEEYLEQYGYNRLDMLPATESSSSSDGDDRFYRQLTLPRRSGTRVARDAELRPRNVEMSLPWWMNETSLPSQSVQPYVPQLGDSVIYLPQGHLQYLRTTRGEMDDQLEDDVRDMTVVSFKMTVDSNHVFNVKLEAGGGHRRGFSQCFNLRYHWVENSPPILVLRSVYEKSLTYSWVEGDRFRSLRSDDEGWHWDYGSIVTHRPLDVNLPNSLFQSIIVSWDSDEIGKVSPWDIEPFTSDEAAPSCYQHEMRNENWDGRDYFETEKMRLVTCLTQLSRMSSFAPFSEAVDFSQFEAYLSVVAQPMDLQLIIARLNHDYYRSRRSLERDIKLISINARTFNQPRSSIVSSSVVLVKACLTLLRDNTIHDIHETVARLADGIPSRREVEEDTLEPGQWEYSAHEMMSAFHSREDFTTLQTYHDFFQQNCYRGVVFDDELRRLKIGVFMSPVTFRDEIRNKFDGWLSLCRERPRSRIFKLLFSLEKHFEENFEQIIDTWKSSARGLRRCRKIGCNSSVTFDMEQSNSSNHFYNTRQRSAQLAESAPPAPTDLNVSDSSCDNFPQPSTTRKRDSTKRRRKIVYSDENSSDNEASSSESTSNGTSTDDFAPESGRRYPTRGSRDLLERSKHQSDRAFRYVLRGHRRDESLNSDCNDSIVPSHAKRS